MQSSGSTRSRKGTPSSTSDQPGTYSAMANAFIAFVNKVTGELVFVKAKMAYVVENWSE